VPGTAISLADRIDACLPQTQCGRCGYEGCRPYANAIASGVSLPNRCPPGGLDTSRALSELLAEVVGPVDPACGEATLWATVRIDQSHCIGCVLCIKACPVDAIVGAPKRGHAVLTSECTGCELCIAPCPVDCIDLVKPLPDEMNDESATKAWRGWMQRRAPRARAKFRAREERLRQVARWRSKLAPDSTDSAAPSARLRMERTIEAALTRVAEKRAARNLSAGGSGPKSSEA